MYIELHKLKPCLEEHCAPGVIACHILNIMGQAEYSREEIRAVAQKLQEYTEEFPE